MRYRKLGHSGLMISEISLGSWLTFGQSLDDAATEECMRTAYDAGVNFFDGGEAYGNGNAESAMGRVFKKMGWSRDTLIISGKVFEVGPKPTQRGLSRKHLIDACNGALSRMGLEYLDLFFCHRPDPNTPLEETVFAMNDLIRQGKILYWGTSEYSAADLIRMHQIARENHLIGPSMEQCKYNMLERHRIDQALVPVFETTGMGTTVFSPLCFGILTGKYNDGIPQDSRLGRGKFRDRLTQERIDKVRKLTELAGDVGINTATLALAWVLKNPNVSTAIIGSTKSSQIEENIKAVDAQEKLTDETMQSIETILKS